MYHLHKVDVQTHNYTVNVHWCVCVLQSVYCLRLETCSPWHICKCAGRFAKTKQKSMSCLKSQAAAADWCFSQLCNETQRRRTRNQPEFRANKTPHTRLQITAHISRSASAKSKKNHRQKGSGWDGALVLVDKKKTGFQIQHLNTSTNVDEWTQNTDIQPEIRQ